MSIALGSDAAILPTLLGAVKDSFRPGMAQALQLLSKLRFLMTLGFGEGCLLLQTDNNFASQDATNACEMNGNAVNGNALRD